MTSTEKAFARAILGFEKNIKAEIRGQHDVIIVEMEALGKKIDMLKKAKEQEQMHSNPPLENGYQRNFLREGSGVPFGNLPFSPQQQQHYQPRYVRPPGRRSQPVYGEYRGAGGGPQVNSPLIPPTNFSTFPLTPRETPAASFHQSSSRPQTRPRYTNKRGNPRNSFSTTTTNKYHAMAQQASDLDFPARMSSEEERVVSSVTVNLVTNTISEDTVKKAMKTKTDKMVEKNVETGKNVLATKDLKENHFKIAEKKEEKESIYKKEKPMPARNASSESETAEGVPPSDDDENDSYYDVEDTSAVIATPNVTNNNEKLDVDETKKAFEDVPNPAANSYSEDKPVANLVVSKPAPPSPQIDRPSVNQKMCYYEVVSVSNKEKQSSVNNQKQMNVSPSPQQLGDREAMIKRLKETVAERFTKMSQQQTVETEKKPTENLATLSSTPQQMATPAAASSTVENNKSTPAAAEVPSEKEKKPKLVGGFGMGRRK